MVRRDVQVLGAREVGARKARTLLKLLAAAPERLWSAESLADALWAGEPPTRPTENIATLVSRLRAVLGPEVIRGDRSGWGLGQSVDVDLQSAARLLHQAQACLASHEPGLAGAAAAAALALVDGQVLPEEPAAVWVDQVRAAGTDLLRLARRLGAEAALGSGDFGTAAERAVAATDADRYDEAAVRLLMRAHQGQGQPGQALAAYERLRDRLADELGVDPAPETRAVHLDILRETPAPAPGPAQATVARRPLVVGRDGPLAVLSAAWSAAVEGSGSLLLIAGEAGIGKTALAAELTTMARATGGLVLSSRCYETERSLLLQPLVDALRPELMRSAPGRVREMAGDQAQSLALLLPEVAEIAGPFARDVAAPDIERRRIYESVAGCLRRLSVRSPVLLSLDDLHNCGLTTIELLHLLARGLAGTRLLVVATLRSEEGQEAIRRLSGVSARVDLGPLDEAAVAELAVAAGLGEHTERLMSRTRGHPLFVVESVRALSDGDDGIPASLREAVLARVGRAGPALETLVRAAAVLGASFEPEQVAGLLALSTAEAARRCEQLVDARLAVPSGRAYEFVNDLVQEVLYASTPAPTRHAYHRAAADLMVGRPEAMASHAAASQQWARAAEGWLAAAALAVDRLAAADAERLLDEALVAAVEHGSTAGGAVSGSPAESDELVVRVRLARGRVLESLSSFGPAHEDFSQALAIAERTGQRRWLMEAHSELGGDSTIGLGRPVVTCVPHLEAGLALARELGDRVMEAGQLARLGVLACNRLDFVEGQRLGQLAVEAARGTDDEQALVVALDGLKTSYAYTGELVALAPVVAELHPRLRRSGDLFLLQWTVFEEALIPLAAGDWAAATAGVEEALALNRRSGRESFESWLVAHLGWIARLDGRLPDALGHGRRAVDLTSTRKHAWWDAISVGMYATTLLTAGAGSGQLDAGVVRLLRQVLSAADRSGAESYRLRCLAPLALVTGSDELLLQADRMLTSARFPTGVAWLHGIDVYVTLTQAWLAADRPERALAVLEPLLSAGQRAGWSAVLEASGAVALAGRAGSTAASPAARPPGGDRRSAPGGSRPAGRSRSR